MYAHQQHIHYIYYLFYTKRVINTTTTIRKISIKKIIQNKKENSHQTQTHTDGEILLHIVIIADEKRNNIFDIGQLLKPLFRYCLLFFTFFVFFFVCVFIEIFSDEDGDDETQPTNINDLFDFALELLWSLVTKNGWDMTKLPDISEGFSYVSWKCSISILMH